ncbi:unnamed protein product [Phytophthora fragariaefolia]|uniref:Unnamed protein product n=1 Tax=Phytophthora fragariaefolia TaxID=1490495 RepID=A0A9W6XBU8_9STRA|nr:unnamed protein product [Phytophthora fragariaefolia]
MQLLDSLKPYFRVYSGYRLARVFKVCNPELTLDACRYLSSKKRRRCLHENPGIAARFFHHSFQVFVDNVLCGQSKPLGEIEDFFWRVEFQQRGSPHIHALLWIKYAPDVLKRSESEEGRAELAAFVDRSISVLSKSLQSLETCPCNTCTTQAEEKVDILAVRPPDYGTNEWGCDL